MTKNTTTSGAADDSLLLCATDLQHSAIFDNPHEMVDCVRAVADRITALAASAPVAPSPLSPTAGMNMAQRILHVGGRNPPGSTYVEFGSIQAVEALVKQVLRDLPEAAPVAPAPQPAPMPYPTDAQIDAVYEQTMSQHLRSQDAPAVRRFGRAMFLCAWNAATPKADPIADASKMVPAPLQQGEYLPCPFCGSVNISLTVLDDRSFVMCSSCGVCCDSNDTLPESEPGDVWNRRAARGAAQAAPAPVAEDAEIRKALDDAATALETISRIAGRDRCLLGMMDVRLYAASRAKVAREAQAAQPEGGAKP